MMMKIANQTRQVIQTLIEILPITRLGCGLQHIAIGNQLTGQINKPVKQCRPNPHGPGIFITQNTLSAIRFKRNLLDIRHAVERLRNFIFTTCTFKPDRKLSDRKTLLHFGNRWLA